MTSITGAIILFGSGVLLGIIVMLWSSGDEELRLLKELERYKELHHNKYDADDHEDS